MGNMNLRKGLKLIVRQGEDVSLPFGNVDITGVARDWYGNHVITCRTVTEYVLTGDAAKDFEANVLGIREPRPRQPKPIIRLGEVTDSDQQAA